MAAARAQEATNIAFLVNLVTRYTWTYGLANLFGDTIIDALWHFFIDAGGFPWRLCCNCVRIGASPRYWQSQNGAVLLHNWNTAVEMAQAFLVEDRLPRHYWFLAVREAAVHMNMLPMKAGPSLDYEGAFQAIPSEDAE
jgi:hypothetical protein